MTVEEIRKQIKKEYSDKLSSLTDENHTLRKENDEMLAEIKSLRKRVSNLENEIAKRNKSVNKFFKMKGWKFGGIESDYTI